jgi:ubiquitin-like protein ATG12
MQQNTAAVDPDTPPVPPPCGAEGLEQQPTEAPKETDSKDRPGEAEGAPKVLLCLRSIGEAPALKRNKFKLSGAKQLVEVQRFLSKSLGLPPGHALFLYCGSGFAPTPDQALRNLFDCFQIGGELTISYGVQESYG